MKSENVEYCQLIRVSALQYAKRYKGFDAGGRFCRNLPSCHSLRQTKNWLIPSWNHQGHHAEHCMERCVHGGAGGRGRHQGAEWVNKRELRHRKYIRWIERLSKFFGERVSVVGVGETNM